MRLDWVKRKHSLLLLLPSVVVVLVPGALLWIGLPLVAPANGNHEY